MDGPQIFSKPQLPKVKIGLPLLKRLLRRQIIFDLVKEISNQENPVEFNKGEKLVVLGSGIPCLEGFTYPEAAPRYSPPSDLDLMLFEPLGEQGYGMPKRFTERFRKKNADPLSNSEIDEADKERFAQKNMRSLALEKILQRVASKLNLTVCRQMKDFTEEQFDTVANQHYNVTQKFDIASLKEYFSKPETKRALCRVFDCKDIDIDMNFLADAIAKQSTDGKTLEITLDTQMLGYPVSFLDPAPITGITREDGKHITVMGDDLTNTIALKLVRLMLPDPVTSNYTLAKQHTSKISDLIDIYDTLHILKIKQPEAELDYDLLKILVLMHLSYQTCDSLDQASAAKLAPEPKNLDALQHDLNHYINPLGILVTSFTVAPKITREMAGTAYGLLEKIFPDLGKPHSNPEIQNPDFPITNADREFIDIMQGKLVDPKTGELHAGQVGRFIRNNQEHAVSFKRPHLAALRLLEAYPKEMQHVLKKVPDFIDRAAKNWMTRPFGSTIDEEVMSNGAYVEEKLRGQAINRF